MTINDIDDVLTIERLSYSAPWTKSQFEKEVRNPFSNKYVAKALRGGREVVAAYIIFWVIEEESHILNIATHPEFRRRGIAKSLLFFTLSQLKKRSIGKVFLEVRRSNISAQRLYRYFDFTEVGIRKGYYADNNEDAIVMSLEFEKACKDSLRRDIDRDALS